MVTVPSGSFLMGDQTGTHYEDEAPVHKVVLRSFAISATEITFDQWDQCVAKGGCDADGVDFHGGDNCWGRGNRPVIEVNYYDAQEYIQWLSRETGQVYRLPSEAEWEYAARAGTDTVYF